MADDHSKLAVELNFQCLEDFEPARVAAQVPALKELLDMRGKLRQLLSKMEGNDKLEQLLTDVLSNKDKASALSKLVGDEEPAEEPKPAAPPPPAAKSDDGASALDDLLEDLK